MNLSEMLKAADDKRNQGNWIPANGGTETPFWTRNGYLLLYVYQASTGRHSYMNVQTDLLMSDDEARMALGTY